MSRSMRVAHVIPNLHPDGGAQAMLCRLVLAAADHRHEVYTLQDKGALAPSLESRGIPVRSLGLGGARTLPRTIGELRRRVRDGRFDVVQTWMYHGDLIGGLAARSVAVPVVWGLHHATFGVGGTSRGVRAATTLCARLSSRVPARIVSCSAAGAASHVEKGYDASRMVIVHNGHDGEAFSPRPDGEADSLRDEHGLVRETRLLGMAARWNRQKDHRTLLDALARLDDAAVADWRCMLFGGDMDSDNEELAALIDERDLRERVVLLGRRTDVVDVMRSLDLHVLSSLGEAFPNVLNEAMLVGTPCLTTATGDSALIVGDTGWSVPPGDAVALAERMVDALREMDDVVRWSRRRTACRERVLENFGIGAMVEGYEAVWRDVASSRS